MTYVNSVTFYVRKSTVSKAFMDKLMKALNTSYKDNKSYYEFEVIRLNNLSTDIKTMTNILEIEPPMVTPEQYANELNQYVDNIKTYMDEIA